MMMGEYLYIVLVITLVFVILAQAVERFSYGQQAQREQSKLIAAVLSKNINEYTSAIRVEKEDKAPQFNESDEVDLTHADDETFDKFIERQNT